MSYYRTPEHRQLRAELICKWKPWERSTGPKTPVGKARVARNSYKARMVYRRRSDLDPKLVGQWMRPLFKNSIATERHGSSSSSGLEA
jgi:hypothetical protein